MSKGVGGGRLVYARQPDRRRHRLLNHGFVEMVPVADSRVAIHIVGGRGEDVLPTPVAVAIRVLASEGARKGCSAQVGAEVGLVQAANLLQVLQQGLPGGRR
jgi:hypothetical protein